MFFRCNKIININIVDIIVAFISIFIVFFCYTIFHNVIFFFIYIESFCKFYFYESNVSCLRNNRYDTFYNVFS